MTARVQWISWSRARQAHAVPHYVTNYRVGSFPFLCGQRAPDGFDADMYAEPSGHKCPRCLAALNREATS